MKDPPIFLYDEATSSLDTITEQVRKYMQSLYNTVHYNAVFFFIQKHEKMDSKNVIKQKSKNYTKKKEKKKDHK